MALKAILHRIVAIPLVYDLLQIAVGASFVRTRLKRHLAHLEPRMVVIDMGGGTGLNYRLLPHGTYYVCVDNDEQKLKGLKAKNKRAIPVWGDATQVPQKSNSADLVLLTAVIHHIPDHLLDALFCEAMRVLKPGGRFVIWDPVWAPKRPVGRLLWRYDRGTYPRSQAQLKERFSQHGKLLHWESLAIFHRYIIGVTVKE